MRVVEGGAAVSPFRLRALEAGLRESVPGAGPLAARYVYFVETRQRLDADAEAVLGRLLREGEAWQAPSFSVQRELMVIPRFGTISPWSSKATEIAHHAGLQDSVERIGTRDPLAARRRCRA